MASPYVHHYRLEEASQAGPVQLYIKRNRLPDDDHHRAKVIKYLQDNDNDIYQAQDNICALNYTGAYVPYATEIDIYDEIKRQAAELKKPIQHRRTYLPIQLHYWMSWNLSKIMKSKGYLLGGNKSIRTGILIPLNIMSDICGDVNLIICKRPDYRPKATLLVVELCSIVLQHEDYLGVRRNWDGTRAYYSSIWSKLVSMYPISTLGDERSASEAMVRELLDDTEQYLDNRTASSVRHGGRFMTMVA